MVNYAHKNPSPNYPKKNDEVAVTWQAFLTLLT